MLRIEHLSVWYGLTEVLRDVSFAVGKGQIVALLGGNGAGKTTLLKAMSGLLKPKAGGIWLEDKPIAGLHPHDIVVRGMSQVPQGRFVWPTMTVHDNLVLGAITRNDRAGIREDLDKVYAYFPRLKEKTRRAAGSMSGGEQQMLAIGRALMARPKVLLMDEPSHGLSPLMVEEMVATIARLNEEGMTIFLIEQNVGVAAELAGPTFVLANGEIALETTGHQVAHDPAVLRSYLGR
ncbi:ABC transporter ATP-binding protein [Futiania mangrovi]|uniref:ABC transporter ATP-binding protein n=1 Tax=Futiania mangrovi TaxID=2959716 RepID=A0A9J6PJ66_9PROT|nr:ABC transporter ATP-binding protein [Futiania mangrovii]MCP1337856.1 ABC transporter ATP-binding protein [Futiania mangrovii]